MKSAHLDGNGMKKYMKISFISTLAIKKEIPSPIWLPLQYETKSPKTTVYK
jgi:hypothetical protein